MAQKEEQGQVESESSLYKATKKAGGWRGCTGLCFLWHFYVLLTKGLSTCQTVALERSVWSEHIRASSVALLRTQSTCLYAHTTL